jgi:hypothetical protein
VVQIEGRADPAHGRPGVAAGTPGRRPRSGRAVDHHGEPGRRRGGQRQRRAARAGFSDGLAAGWDALVAVTRALGVTAARCCPSPRCCCSPGCWSGARGGAAPGPASA